MPKLKRNNICDDDGPCKFFVRNDFDSRIRFRLNFLNNNRGSSTYYLLQIMSHTRAGHNQTEIVLFHNYYFYIVFLISASELVKCTQSP